MSFFWVALALPVLLVVQRWIHRHLRGVAYLLTGRQSWAVIVYALVLLPGVVLHEISHWVFANLLGVRTGAVSLLPRQQADGSIQLGYVEYYRHRRLDPVRESLIGGAPLITGTVVILLIGLRVFDVPALSQAIGAGEITHLTGALGELFNTPDFFLWLYLLFAVSNAMLPSPSDRRAWPAFIVLLVVGAAVLLLLRQQAFLVNGLTGPVATVFGFVGLALTLAIGVDLVFMLIIFLVETVVSRLKKVQIQYGGPSPLE
ncbi:MAG: hypothetical protein RRC07_14205 [Anaerolineae bacterium]|nr:hypothetical protein [Anaerolineae bacterium]